VIDLMSTGQWTVSCIAALARKHGVKPRTVYDDRKIALEVLRETLIEATPEERKTRLLAKSDALYRHCIAIDHTATAARLLGFEALILGANEPIKIDLTHRVEQQPDIDVARQILDPQAVAWARTVLADAGEAIPGVLEHEPAILTVDSE
jgi:hypothetical protein